jgi:folate-binding protein YgfZ
MPPADSYAALKEEAGIGAISPRGAIGLRGRDRLTYLQGLLTNDTQALTAGTGCYAAWLTPQGRMLTDLHILESGDMTLLDLPADQVKDTLQRLDQFLFSEDVQLADLSSSLRPVWIHGPAAAAMLEQVLSGASGPPEGGHSLELASWGEYQNGRAQFGEAPVSIARISQLGVPGFCVYLETGREDRLVSALVAAGAVVADAAAIEAARIEAGYPVFGVDMTDDTIPLEAGIEGRAISLTKGCYVGQEVIIRVLHRGHGRVARRLVALTVDGALPVAGAKIFAGDREIGFVTSGARSPRLGPIGLGYVHRDFVAPDSRVEIDAGGRVPATVRTVPL